MNQEPIKMASENVWIGTKSRAIFEQLNRKVVPDIGGNGGKARTINIGKNGNEQVKIWQWGTDNDLPNQREQLVRENNIVGELLATKRTVTIGGGPVFYRFKYVDGKEVKEYVDTPAEFAAFSERSNLGKYLRIACKNLFLHANVFTEVIRDKAGRVHSIKALESRHVRAGEQGPDGKIKNYYWCGNWKSTKREQFPIIKIPAYDPLATKPQPKFIFATGDDLITDDYYCEPAWWGGRKWIELSNKIPVFHIGNLENGYLIRYHIEIPKGYFWDKTAAAQAINDPTAMKKLYEAEENARAEFMRRVDDLLAGEDKAGRTLFSEYEINAQIGKDYPGIKITPINTDLKDKALLDLFDKSNDANISGQGVHPAMAAIQTQGKLSSGSEIRNAYMMYLAIKTPANRDILTEAIMLETENQPWAKGLRMGFRDLEITTLDVNPSGKQDVQQ